MLLWSYFSVVFTDPGSVPPNWKPDLDEERGDSDPLTTSEFGASPADPANPRVRFCKKCNLLKPPRCHHCSVCEFLLCTFCYNFVSIFFFQFEIDMFMFPCFRWKVYIKDGPSLRVGNQLRWSTKLQVFPSFSGKFQYSSSC